MKFRLTSGAKVKREKKTCKLELGVGGSPYMSMCFWSTGEMYHDLLAALHAHFRVLDIFLKEAFPSCQEWPGASHACAPISSWDAAVDEGQMSLLQTKPACQKWSRNQVPESIPRPDANLAIFPFLWGYCCLTLSSSHPRIDQKSLKQLGLSKLSISMASESSQEINQKWLSSRSPKCHLDRRDNQSLRGCLKKQKRNTQINNVLT